MQGVGHWSTNKDWYCLWFKRDKDTSGLEQYRILFEGPINAACEGGESLSFFAKAQRVAIGTFYVRAHHSVCLNPDTPLRYMSKESRAVRTRTSWLRLATLHISYGLFGLPWVWDLATALRKLLPGIAYPDWFSHPKMIKNAVYVYWVYHYSFNEQYKSTHLAYGILFGWWNYGMLLCSR